MARIPNSDLDVFPLALGGNVFGWTADERESFAVLDAYAAAGGNVIDTADAYSAWAPGNSGGESETIIGRWLARHGRDDVTVITKVSQHPEARGLSRDAIRRASEASLRRLGTDRIDLYFAHFDDESTPLEETVAALGELVTEGRVRYLGLSNYTADRAERAIALAEQAGSAPFVALQPHYNLVERDRFEGSGLSLLAAHKGLGVLPYYGLASGFLTGKYRDGSAGDSPRAGGAAKYLDDRGRAVLAALDEVAAAHSASVATVALAWLAGRPTVVAPIASARTAEQVADLVAVADLKLSPEETAALDAASA